MRSSGAQRAIATSRPNEFLTPRVGRGVKTKQGRTNGHRCRQPI